MGIFSRNKEEIIILQKTQDNIELTQKNMCVLIDKISNVVDKQYKEKTEKVITEEDKIRAAYALNMCTISVSQIIDYNDLNILEQEYDVILNNLNLEYMPKDEALLNTLKILLDTITFFRIQEGDKQFIEKEYQDKVKNAIWSAVPNFGLIIAGGNPWSMAVSLASQVGCGYMNYRRAKAQNLLDKEKAEWELQRSAIEQFNGIRRELFDAAWRLADKYQFPDRYRLTERKIKQYNNILMDPDNYRRYDRLNAIKEKFQAYPPFWYYLGNTANLIAQEEEDIGVSAYYKELAKKHFEKFFEGNKYPLLREDQILASCCLEYIDLLDINLDKEKINNLLDKAVQTSGDYNDLLQLCAVYYLKVGNVENASNLLIRLVNEDYNATTNAQILSKIYVYNYINNKSSSAKYDYKVLEKRVDTQFLFPMPVKSLDSAEGLQEEFLEKQRKVLLKKYMLVLDAFTERYNIRYNKIFPVTNINSSYKDSYFNDKINSHKNRIDELKEVLKNKNKAEDYKVRLSNVNISFAILEILNEVFDALSFLNCIDYEEELAILIKINIDNNKKLLNELEKSLNENRFGEDEIDILQKLSFKAFTDLYFDQIAESVKKYIYKKKSMDEFSYVEQNLREFCIRESISEPEVLFKRSENYQYIDVYKKKQFSLELLGEEAIKTKKETDTSREMIKVINKYNEDLIFNKEKISLFIKGDGNFDMYMSKKSSKINMDFRKRIIGVLEDRSFNSYDIIFTTTGIVLVGLIALKAEVSYDDIEWCDTANTVIRIGEEYKNKNLNLPKFYDLLQELAGFIDVD
ncbi:hypothetical protein LGK99_05740 [Clostridium algidicarnis]|uniref:hypothetical protein n=1 Tax=Clostridium algidicarnis TaxID=37659 RepID=UPI001CF58578|nr:hypothetical protein [Clostridium algidicarnis]MCB2286605.1 hypothetical protein [Clostridium algidicarnis]